MKKLIIGSILIFSSTGVFAHSRHSNICSEQVKQSIRQHLGLSQETSVICQQDNESVKEKVIDIELNRRFKVVLTTANNEIYYIRTQAANSPREEQEEHYDKFDSDDVGDDDRH